MKWQYKILDYSGFDASDVQNELNVLGEQGWEVFNIWITSPPTNSAYITKVVYHLKRSK